MARNTLEDVQGRSVHFQTQRDDHGFDEIRISLVPRFKTSDMSGDEWRVSALVELFRKRQVIFRQETSRLEDAVALVPWLLRTVSEKPNDHEGWTAAARARFSGPALYGLGENECAQATCHRTPVVFYSMKKEFSENGHFEKEISPSDVYVRGFCDLHKDRGDGARDDAMHNYEPITLVRKPATGTS